MNTQTPKELSDRLRALEQLEGGEEGEWLTKEEMLKVFSYKTARIKRLMQIPARNPEHVFALFDDLVEIIDYLATMVRNEEYEKEARK